MKQIGIIGAGAAGLCALRHTLAIPGINPVVWEHSTAVGGTWVYSCETGRDQYQFPIHSSMYNSLRTNLPKEIMGFPDFPFKGENESFIHHTEVLKYLKDYCNHFQLAQWIKFEHHVHSVERIEGENGNTLWEIEVENLRDKIVKRVICDGILICNGHYSVPSIPKIKELEAYTGTQIHSHEYRYPDPYRLRNVVILGASASGMDISLEVATVANKVYLSHNFPVPLPSKFPKNVIQVKGIEKATVNGFILIDDAQIKVDDIIFCTGYEYQFPFLKPTCEVEVIDNSYVKPLYKHIIHTSYPSMGFIGLVFQVLPFPLFEMQVTFYLSAFIKKFELPCTRELELELQKDIAEITCNEQPMRYYHRLGDRQWKYMKYLCSKTENCLKNSNYLHQMKTIWNIVWYRRLFSLMSYKEYDYIVKNSGSKGYILEEYHKGMKVHTSSSLAVMICIQGLRFIILNLLQIAKLLWKKFEVMLARIFAV